jgi:hypothetical protein
MYSSAFLTGAVRATSVGEGEQDGPLIRSCLVGHGRSDEHLANPRNGAGRMPSRSRATVLIILAAIPLAIADAARAEDLPTRIGACGESAITFIGGRLEGDETFDTGTAVQFDNGGVQISYDRVDGVVNSRIGDRVRICLVSIPQDCPPGDDRGRVYDTTNLRTGESWEMPDSSHMCGGA